MNTTKMATDRVKSILWMISWSFSFSLAMAMTKFLSNEIPSVMIVFIRSIFGLVLFAPFIFKQGLRKVKTSHPFLYLLYTLFGTGAMISTYYAYSILPLATATSIGFTGPSIAVVLAMFVFSERVSLEKWIFILLGYLGVLMIAQPGVIEFHPAILVALLANLFAGGGLMTMKKLTTYEKPEKITFTSSLLRIILLIFAIPFFWAMPSLHDIFFLSLIGIFGTFSQFSYIQALKYGQVSLATPFEYSRLVIAIPLGFLLFAEIPTLWVVLGGLVIVASNFGLTSIDLLRKRTKAIAKS